jgi:hypothetical protein
MLSMMIDSTQGLIVVDSTRQWLQPSSFGPYVLLALDDTSHTAESLTSEAAL